MNLKTVTVIVAAFEAHEWIAKCLDSILDQDILPSYKLQLIVGIDGCEKTLAALSDRHRALAEIYMMEKNYGTYITFNTMANFAKGDIICRFDADDYMYPNFLRTGMITLLAQKVDHVRFLFDREWKDAVTDRENLEPSLGTIMFTRKMWLALGGYQPWRVSADCDFIRRAVIAKFKCAVPVQALFFYRHHDQSLTQAVGSRWDSVERQKIKEVQTQSTRCYEKYGTQALKVVPLQGKAKKLASEDDVPQKSFDKSVTVSIASMPARVESLSQVVSSLLPQVDKLNVYLNNYQNVPSFLNHKKIEVARSQDHWDLKDNAKFWWAAKVRGYHLTCDDDIDYPANYVEKMIAAIDRYERKAIISCYGLAIHSNFKKLYEDGYKCHPYDRELKSDQAIHIPGTGVMGYHSDGCGLMIEHFPKFASADIWVGTYTQRMHIPVICMAHKRDWLGTRAHPASIGRDSKEGKDTTMNTADLQTELILSQQPWKLNRYESFDKSVTVSIASIPQRVETLQKVVSSLLPQVDKLNVYLNNYVDVPLFLNQPKIEVARSQDHGDLGDNGKFWWAEKVRGYHLTCDDDIGYPANYVEEMIAVIERYERKAIISCHGSIVPHNFRKSYDYGQPGARKVFAFHREVKEDQFIHIPGTGVMGYHSDGCGLTMEHFPKFINADIFVAKYTQQMHIPVICMAHKREWVVSWEYEDSIYMNSLRNTGTEMDTEAAVTELILSQKPWKLNRFSADNKSVVSYTPRIISVIMAAWQAELWIEESIRSVLSQDLPVGWTLELLIGTDDCARTQEVSKKFYEDDRVGFVHFGTNRGTYAVFNDLLGLSRGELVSRFDADDVMFPRRLFEIIKKFENPEVDLVNTYFYTEAIPGSWKTVVCGGNKKSAPNPPHMGSYVWRRNALEKIGSFEPWKCHADFEILMQADLAGLKRAVIEKPMLYYRQHSNSLTGGGETEVGGKLRNDYNKEIDRRRQNKSVREPFVPRKVDGDFQGALWVVRKSSKG